MKLMIDRLSPYHLEFLKIDPPSGRVAGLACTSTQPDYCSVTFFDPQTLDEIYTVEAPGDYIRGLDISDNGEYLFIALMLTASPLIRRVGERFPGNGFRFTARFATAGFLAGETKLMAANRGGYMIFDPHYDKITDVYDEELTDRCAGFSFLPGISRFLVSDCSQGSSSLGLLDFSEPDGGIYYSMECDEMTAPSWSQDGMFASVGHDVPVIFSVGEKIEPIMAFDLDGQLTDHQPHDVIVPFLRLWTRQIFHPTRNSVIAGSPDGMIYEWSLRDGRILNQVQAHDGKVWAICLLQDSSVLVSSGTDKHLRTWNLTE